MYRADTPDEVVGREPQTQAAAADPHAPLSVTISRKANGTAGKRLLSERGRISAGQRERRRRSRPMTTLPL